MIITTVKILVILDIAVMVTILYLHIIKPKDDVGVTDQEWKDWLKYMEEYRVKKDKKNRKKKGHK